MASRKTAVFGIYSSREAVETAADVLTRSGFPVTDISVLLPESLGTKDLGTQKATKAPEGAAAGAGSGAVLGGTLGLLAGIGALAIPGVGPLIAAGPIMATLAGIGVGGAVGGFTGALIGIGIPEYEAKRYEGRLHRGGILLSVHCDTSDEIDRAKAILERTGGEDISSTGESSTGTQKADQRVRGSASGGND
ncbi:MAG TPA: hypothetical protein VGP19_13660 [Candidatus Acidoferrales bacterium]|jgi:hypothetical protein|nr:hypothetical protein [Candidatus Acidoferrales bacterium]